MLTCVRTATAVTLYVDGVFMNRKRGVTGRIDNKQPLTIGGKTECDQVTVTCDYFSRVNRLRQDHRGTYAVPRPRVD